MTKSCSTLIHTLSFVLEVKFGQCCKTRGWVSQNGCQQECISHEEGKNIGKYEGKVMKRTLFKKVIFSFLKELLDKVKSTALSSHKAKNCFSCLRPFVSLTNKDSIYPSPQNRRVISVSGSASSLQFKFLLRLKTLLLSARAKLSLCAPPSLLQLPGEHLFHVYIRSKLVCMHD